MDSFLVKKAKEMLQSDTLKSAALAAFREPVLGFNVGDGKLEADPGSDVRNCTIHGRLVAERGACVYGLVVEKGLTVIVRQNTIIVNCQMSMNPFYDPVPGKERTLEIGEECRIWDSWFEDVEHINCGSFIWGSSIRSDMRMGKGCCLIASNTYSWSEIGDSCIIWNAIIDSRDTAFGDRLCIIPHSFKDKKKRETVLTTMKEQAKRIGYPERADARAYEPLRTKIAAIITNKRSLGKDINVDSSRPKGRVGSDCLITATCGIETLSSLEIGDRFKFVPLTDISGHRATLGRGAVHGIACKDLCIGNDCTLVVANSEYANYAVRGRSPRSSTVSKVVLENSSITVQTKPIRHPLGLIYKAPWGTTVAI